MSNPPCPPDGGLPAASSISVATVAVGEAPEAVWQCLQAALSCDERARAVRFSFERHRREYVAAHALARLMLSEACFRRPQDLVFKAEPGGKPFLADAAHAHFNLSHCDGLVACAVSRDVAVGVDVEPTDRDVPVEIADRYFAPAERAWLSGLPEAERGLGFLRLWTLKEAVIKATGRGVAQDLQSFTLSLDPPRIDWHGAERPTQEAWRLEQHVIGDRHLLALAWRGPAAMVTLRALSLAELVAGLSMHGKEGVLF